MTSTDHIVHTQTLPCNFGGGPSSDHSKKPDWTASPDSKAFSQTGIQVDLWSLCCRRNTLINTTSALCNKMDLLSYMCFWLQ